MHFSQQSTGMECGLLEPRYSEHFRCLGTECEDNCCQGWEVFIDKATYKKYRATLALRRLAAENIQVDPQCSSPLKYGRLKLKGDGSCPFLTPEKLCGIHQEHGSGYLSELCSRYPRAINRFGGATQIALHMSCPEAARRILLSPALIHIPESVRYREFLCQNSLAVTRPAAQSLSAQLRSFASQLLQDRSYPLWQRLFLLGTVCRRIHELAAAKEMSSVPNVLRQYAEIVLSGGLRTELERIPARPEPQLRLVLELLQCRFKVEPPSGEFASYTADLLLVMGYSPESPLQDCAARYQEAYTRFYKRFSESYPNFMENYLINYIFRTRFPFADTIDKVESGIEPACSYLLMVFHYRLLESMLVGGAARYGQEFSITRALKLAVSFAKAIEHQAVFLENIKALIRSSDPLTTDGLAALLRN